MVRGASGEDHCALLGSSGVPSARPSVGDQSGTAPGARPCRPLWWTPMMKVWPATRAPRWSESRRAKSMPRAAPRVSQVRNQTRAPGTRRSRSASSPRWRRCRGESAPASSGVAADERGAPLPVAPELDLGDGAARAPSQPSASSQVETPRAPSSRPSPRYSPAPAHHAVESPTGRAQVRSWHHQARSHGRPILSARARPALALLPRGRRR